MRGYWIGLTIRFFSRKNLKAIDHAAYSFSLCCHKHIQSDYHAACTHNRKWRSLKHWNKSLFFNWYRTKLYLPQLSTEGYHSIKICQSFIRCFQGASILLGREKSALFRITAFRNNHLALHLQLHNDVINAYLWFNFCSIPQQYQRQVEARCYVTVFLSHIMVNSHLGQFFLRKGRI